MAWIHTLLCVERAEKCLMLSGITQLDSADGGFLLGGGRLTN